jgi:hypothetical protein
MATRCELKFSSAAQCRFSRSTYDTCSLSMKRWLALGRHARLGRVGLVGPHVVVLQRGQHGFDPGLDLGGFVAGTVASQQELQHERRHVGALLHAVQQILADDFAGVEFVQFAIQFVHRYTV